MTAIVMLDDVAEFIRGATFKPDEIVEFGASDSVVCMRTKNVQKDLDESDLISIPRSCVKNGNISITPYIRVKCYRISIVVR